MALSSASALPQRKRNGQGAIATSADKALKPTRRAARLFALVYNLRNFFEVKVNRARAGDNISRSRD